MTPWELVKKSEHSHQRAVFAWANCAARYGFGVASEPRGYSLVEREKWFGGVITHPGVPELSRLFAVHNQGHGDLIRGAQAKAEGVKPGVPDMMLPVTRLVAGTGGGGWAPVRCPGLFVELKRTKAGKAAAGTTTDIQDDWNTYLWGQGYQVATCVGWIDAVNTIAHYMGSEVRVS